VSARRDDVRAPLPVSEEEIAAAADLDVSRFIVASPFQYTMPPSNPWIETAIKLCFGSESIETLTTADRQIAPGIALRLRDGVSLDAANRHMFVLLRSSRPRFEPKIESAAFWLHNWVDVVDAEESAKAAGSDR